MVKKAKILTGIKGLDEMLDGGIVSGTSIVVAGSPGTGKTTLGVEFIYRGITKHNENGIIITFEELPDRLCDDMMNFGWDLKKLEQQGKLKIMATSPFVLQQMRIYKNKLDEMIDSVKAKRVLLDSVTLFKSLVKEKDKLREEIYSLINYFKTKGITAIFTHELPKVKSSELQISDFGIGFLVDGIILLRHVEMGSELKKFITILKMRGTNHDKSIREFEITNKGLAIQLPFKDYENLMGGSAHRSSYKSVKKFFEK